MPEVPYREFILRRLHSLTGIVPMGVFLFEHFWTNSYALQGAERFNEAADHIRGFPFILLIEIFGLALPFAFHIVYGIKIIYSGDYTIYANNPVKNWMYVLQRVTAFPILAFLVFHIFTVRILHGIGDDVDLHATMVDVFANKFILAFYVVGIVCTCFHFANGIATAAITWGLTIGPTSQKVAGAAAAGVGLVLSGMALWSIRGFMPEAVPEAAGAIEVLKDAPQTVLYLIESLRGVIA